ncbi:MAG: GNAT family N-acetyltransferase [Myxococcota bacterium]
MQTRRVAADDWRLLKELRLASLADAPAAFLSTHADEVAFEDARWRERAEANAAGTRLAGFLAVPDGGAAVGLVVGVDQAERDEVSLNALWVAPHARGRGAGRALVEAVVRWARARGRAAVTLCVLEGNEGAARLYRAVGFVPDEVCAGPDGRMQHGFRLELTDAAEP